VLDAILFERAGVPAIAVVTEPFRATGEAMAELIRDDAQRRILLLDCVATRLSSRNESGPCADISFVCGAHQNSPILEWRSAIRCCGTACALDWYDLPGPDSGSPRSRTSFALVRMRAD
jgi:hypothetical protein